MDATQNQKPAVLLIGGLDPQGCAGMSADIMTVQNHGCHPLSLITGLTEQSAEGLTEFGLVSPITKMKLTIIIEKAASWL